MTFPANRKPHGKRISSYGLGRTAFFACQFDQRFSYCLYVPNNFDEDGTATYPLAVVVHGSLRNAAESRDAFIDFAEREQCVILAPLFPCGIEDPADVHNYKFIAYRGIRFDLVLLAMIDEVAETYRLRRDRFLLFGFSGGGHFAHRFAYLHPERLLAVAVGAPGSVTLLRDDRDYWVGIRNVEQIFGHPVDLAALRQVPVLLVIGGDDTETWEITIPRDSPTWMPGAEDAGVNRLDRMASLRASLEQHGIDFRQVIVPGVGHDASQVLEPVKAFFSEILARSRAG